MSEELKRLAIEGAQYTVCSKTGIEFAQVPAGSFYGGHMVGERITTPAFMMARHPVTNGQWHQFVKETGYSPTDDHADLYLKHWEPDRQPTAEMINHPVTWISFIDALHFTRWADAFVPSEWYWEKAARGIDGRLCPWGDEVELAGTVAHIRQTSTAVVGAYSHVITAFGCEQMIGNVSELCLRIEEPSGEPAKQPVPESVGDDDLIALRGSCFLRSASRTMVCSYRRRLSARRRNAWMGLRVCRPAEEARP